MRCPSCGEVNRLERLYCAQCGGRLGHVCAACGAPNQPGDHFCGRCGQALDGDPPPSPKPASAGGRYQVRQLLGEGGRKRVFLATDLRLDRDVALAVIRTEGLDAAAVGRVHDEARAMARLGDHPHIVTVYDAGEDEGRPYIVSQYMAGGSVDDLLRAAAQHRLSIEDTLRIGRQVAAALAHAHAGGVIHRDVKPSNVWLTAEGVAKLGDFGLARRSSRVSADGLLVGTVTYMAPEQALGRTIDARSDLYALGAMLYEMVAGRPPFLGDDAVAVVSQHLNTAPVAPSWHNAVVPRALEAVILRLLAKAPDERFATASAVAEALGGISPAAPPAPTPSAEAPNPLDRLAGGVFVGRAQESELLRAAVEDARAGRGRLVLLAGEPGIGKSRIASELATYAGLRGCQVVWGRCHETEGAPAYWPWMQIVRAYLQDRDPASIRSEMGIGAAAIAQVVPEVRDRLPDLPLPAALEPEQARFRLFDSVTGFLRNVAARRPTVLIIDDLHWADTASLLLLQFLAREMDGMRLMVVATFRDQDYGREHPLADALGDLMRAAATRRIPLAGLGEEDVGRYIEMTAGLSAPEALVHLVHRETDGNPFFLGEVVRLLIAEGRLAATEPRDGWTSRVPQGAREVIARRLGTLTPGCQRTLAVASVMGRDVDLDVLARVAELAGEPVADRLTEAVRARVLLDASAGSTARYRFAHALLRETLYGELPPTRRAQLHHEIGTALEARYGTAREQHLAELAHHFCAAGRDDADKAVDYARRAGDHAVRLLAYEEGARLYQRALDTLATAPAVDEGLRCELTLAQGEAVGRTGDSDRARELCRRAADLARTTGAPDQLARAALAYRTWWVTGLVDEFHLALLEEALRALPRADSMLRARVTARFAAELAFAPAGARRDELSRDALAMARRLGDPSTLAYALHCRHLACWGPDDLEARTALTTEMVQLAQRVGDRDLEARGRHLRITNLLELGDLEALDAEIAAHARLADELHQPLYRWQKTYFASMRAALAGRFDEAETLAEQALVIGQQKDIDAEQTYGVQMLRVRQAQGRLVELEPFVQAYVEQQPAALGWRCVLSLIEAELDKREETLREFEHLAAADFGDLPQDLLWLINLSNLVTACVYLGDTRRAAALYRLLLPYARRNVVVGGGVACQKSTSYLLGLLAATMSRWDDAVGHFEDALTLARRLGARPFVVETEVPYARVLLERGRPGDTARALEMLNHALDLAREIGMKPLVEQGLGLKLRLQGIEDADVQTSIDAVASAVEEERPDLRAHAAPDGTVTILFSDIEGFSAMARRLGAERADEILRAHGAIIRDHVTAQRGLEVKSHGDGFMVVFSSARRAVLCAIAIQRALAGYSAQHPEEPIRARVGLHMGDVGREDDDFFGHAVVLAAGIAAHARGGEILVSPVVRDLVVSAGDLPFGEGREIELSGLPQVPKVYEVLWIGTAPAEARLATGPRNVFRAEGEYWTLAYEGNVCRLRDAKGLHHIAHLLRHPGRQFDARVLVAPAGDPFAGGTLSPNGRARDDEVPALALGDAGPVLDAQARTAYQRRLAELREDLEEAERFNDTGRAGRLREEIEFLSDQLSAAVGLGGRSRRAASAAERARLTVTKRIKDALSKVRESHPALGDYLAARIKTGYQCAYLPETDRRISWEV